MKQNYFIIIKRNVLCMYKILIIEDDKDINNMLKQLLETNHYQVLQAFSGTEGVLVHNENVSLILLDLMLPGKNGEEILAELLNKYQVPIIVMSAIHEVDKKVDLFELGADDYITKPFDNKELLARIKLALKRQNMEKNKAIITFKDIVLNKTDYTVTCNGKPLNFTKQEFELFKTLLEHPTRVFTKSVLFELVWKDEFVDDNTLNVHISKIRNKLKECNQEEDYIETVWSIGYKMKN